MQGTQEHAAQGRQGNQNRLAGEKSPYLLQHRHNPVDWYPWGEAAFAAARAADKPIFLSIGYSTCHWCHVMERESFENPEVAAVLSRHFVSVKVDREERPDVDRIYMTFVQATTGQGGWPMSVFLTPELKPFFGGTYFPPETRHGRPGFVHLLNQVARLWAERRQDIERSAGSLHAQLERLSTQPPGGASPGIEVVRRAGALLKEAYDPREGGFGGAPKFPHPAQPQLLLRFARRFQDPEARDMVLHTCDRMAAGGIRDHLGGGFARYAVDAHWLVPHFEKMLYDNAQLAQLYLDAFLVSGRPGYADVAREILDYVLRDMTHPAGGFCSAEDADSEGHEGKFYCWTLAELERLLSPEELRVAQRYFGLTAQGNFVDHSHPQPLAGQNVLSIVDPSLSAAEAPILAAACQKMIATRARRVRPHLDDKVLASWNGLMLGAFARASAVLADSGYLAAAERNAAFLRAHLWDPAERRLSHRWRDGESDRVELLQGYAFLLSGMLDLYEATVKPEHLEFCVELAETMLERFYDSEQGGFWQSAAPAGDLILRIKDDYDGAEPSGNSVAVLSLLRLGAITGREDFAGSAKKTLDYFSGRVSELPQALPFLVSALDFGLEPPRRAVIAGDPALAGTRELLRAVHSVWQPNRVVLGTGGPVEPFARTLGAESQPKAFFCTASECLPPVELPAEARRLAAL